MEQHLYGTPEMVKQFRSGKMKSDKELPDFLETLKIMIQEHALSEEPLPFPKLDAQMSKQEFITAFDRIPFDASVVLENEKIRQREHHNNAIFPPGRDVISVQHIHNYGYLEQPHLNFFSVTYVYEGKCEFKIGKDLLKLSTGDLCIVSPEFPFATHTFPDSFAIEALVRKESFPTVFHDFLATPSRLSDFLNHAVMNGDQNYCVLHTDPEDDEMSFYLQAFVCDNISDDVYANACAVSLLKLFLGRAYRKYQDTMQVYHDDFYQRKIDADSILLYIRNHYMDITLDQTAEYFHYNKTYLSRYIRNQFGKSFVELVRDLKLDQAKGYLRSTNKHISEIALLAGYDSADHFSRMFRKYEGISPAAYRKKCRNTGEDPEERP